MPNFDGGVKMRNLLFFLSSFLFGVCLWLGVRVALLEYVHMPERALWLAKSRMVEGYRYRTGDVVIIGSSRAMAINPERLRKQYNLRAINFSVGGATTPSTYFFLKRVLKNNPGIKKVYLEFAPMNMTKKDTGLEASLGENFIRYSATAEEALELDKDLPGALAMYHAIHSFPFARFANMKDMSLLEGVVVRWRTGNTDTKLIDNIAADGGYFLYPVKFAPLLGSRTTAFDREADEGYKKLSEYTKTLPPVTAVYYYKIIKLMEEKNIECNIFFSPVYNAQFKYDHLAFGATYQLFKSTNGIVNDNIPVLGMECFSEPSHVNYKGSEKFTDYFNKCVINGECDGNSTARLFAVKPAVAIMRDLDAKK
jgi:hypothetical protein